MENKASDKRQDNWCVYMHENRFNGKKYIGITGQKPTVRWGNGHGYKRCPFFYKAIQKYGWDGFHHEILFTNLTLEEAEKAERDLIKKYKTSQVKKGYNLAEGGSVNSGFSRSDDFKIRLSESKRGHVVSDKTRYKIGKANSGRVPSDSTREKISQGLSGLKRSPEVKARMSASKKGHTVSSETRAKISRANIGGPGAPKIKVTCIDTGEIFQSVKDAAMSINSKSPNVVKCCKGQRSKAGGLRWAYADQATVGK